MSEWLGIARSGGEPKALLGRVIEAEVGLERKVPSYQRWRANRVSGEARRACAAVPRVAVSWDFLWTAAEPADAARICWYVRRPVRRKPVPCAAKTSPKMLGKDNAGARECAAKGRGRRAELVFGGLRCLTFELS